LTPGQKSSHRTAVGAVDPFLGWLGLGEVLGAELQILLQPHVGEFLGTDQCVIFGMDQQQPCDFYIIIFILFSFVPP